MLWDRCSPWAFILRKPGLCQSATSSLSAPRALQYRDALREDRPEFPRRVARLRTRLAQQLTAALENRLRQAAVIRPELQQYGFGLSSRHIRLQLWMVPEGATAL
jgi:hypothetical protein